ncbi:hypothetical protein MLD38_002694 [Melastoma candidum]|uniref:Uncharacterized protein n=1 Tax=Melastoma candidum TaxID=119954 RepID=A0ACB9S0A4_9MYRT|nr:hypothetical protein MLD38_002694 [Melastoma candidum]
MAGRWIGKVTGPLVCMPLRRQSRGIWFGDDLRNNMLSLFSFQIIMINLLAEALSFLLRPLKQPKVVCHFLAGLLVSPNVMGRFKILRGLMLNVEEFSLIGTVGFLGIMYFLFILAVKTDLGVLQRTLKKAPVVGLFTVFGTYVLMCAVVRFVNLPNMKKGSFPFLFSMAMSVTRFPNVAMTFNELNLMTSELGQMAMSCTMISEMLVWIWSLIEMYLQFSSIRGFSSIYSAAAMMVLFLVLRPGISYIIQRSQRGKPVTETVIALILVAALIVLFMGDMFGLIQLGILIFGLMIPSGPPLGSTLSEKAETFITDVLFPTYYITVGYSLDLSQPNLKATVKIVGIAVAATLLKFIGTSSSAYYLCSIKFHDSVVLAMMMVMRGPFDLFLYNRWAFLKDIDRQISTVLALCDIMATATMTPLIDRLYNPHARLRAAGKNARFFISTLRNTELQVMFCIHGEDDVPGVVNLLDALAPSIARPIHAYILHLNELSGQAIPEIVPYDKSERKLKSSGSSHIIRAFHNYASNTPGIASIRPFSVTAEHGNMHEYICRLAQQEQIPLIVVPFQANRGIDAAESTAIRTVNSNLQAYSPCTVGLLISRGIDQNSQPADFPGGVMVVFITGNDDREALAMGIRMSGNLNVRVTLIRITVVGWECDSIEEKAEKKMDDLLIDQFIAEKETNEHVGYHEIMAENLEQVMKCVRDMEGGNNLVVVGRQRRKTKLLDEDMMLDWSDNPELGVLGDMIVSADYLSSMSVLVMQHYGDVNSSSRDELKEDEGQHLLLKPT